VNLKNILALILLNALILLASYILIAAEKLTLSIGDIAILSGGFSVIAIITLVIFIKGQSKEPDSQTFHTLVAISLKFLLELIFALLWFFNSKKNSFEAVLIFFVLYLALSLFSIWLILKTLKNKAL
jgi:F0F1-type ATP synthase assembly protein I